MAIGKLADTSNATPRYAARLSGTTINSVPTQLVVVTSHVAGSDSDDDDDDDDDDDSLPAAGGTGSRAPIGAHSKSDGVLQFVDRPESTNPSTSVHVPVK